MVVQRLGTARGMLICTVVASPFMLLVPATSRGPALALFAVGTLVYGAGTSVSNILAGSFTQTYVPARLPGRYSGAINLVIRGSQPPGVLAGAVIGELAGARAAMWIAAAVITASAGVLFLGPLRQRHDFPTAHPAELPSEAVA